MHSTVTSRGAPTASSRTSTRLRKQHSSRLVCCNASSSTSITGLSSALKDARKQAANSDDQLSVFMSSLSGSELSDSDFAETGQQVNLLNSTSSDDADDQLPLTYDPEAIADYWSVRPVSVVSRVLQLGSISSTFVAGLLWDWATGQLKNNEVRRAIEIRQIVTSLGPAYIKLGQALSIRPDLLSPPAMKEMQKLCDKVPSFDNDVAMAVVNSELGRPWQEVYKELSPAPIAAASLGQVYKGYLHTGEKVAVKVQRPAVLETVTIDLFILRSLGMSLKAFPDVQTDVVGLLDEWAERFFEELDYVKEGQNATIFAEQMKEDLPQVVVAKTYEEWTARRVLTSEWLEGEKLSQSQASDVGALVNLGVICYLKQLLDTGFFHADPHPGNLIRTPDGRLAILDFGLMTEIDDNIKFGMIEAISHLIHRDYEAIVEDFVTLQFIPEGTDLKPILPVLANVFDQALDGGGAKNINFQELAADLAEITFEYPFRIPPYFALIIRAISVLEGIALVGDDDFAIIDEAFPYIAQRLLTDDSPRLRAALRYMVYGRGSTLDIERLIDLLSALETFSVNSKTATGDLLTNTEGTSAPGTAPSLPGDVGAPRPVPPPPIIPGIPLPEFPSPIPQIFAPVFAPLTQGVMAGTMAGQPGALAPFDSGAAASGAADGMTKEPRVRAALQFMLSPEGSFFRSFLLDEIVNSIDALSRSQVDELVRQLNLEDVLLPVWLPGATRRSLPLAGHVTEEDRQQVQSVAKLMNFLVGGSLRDAFTRTSMQADVLPLLPRVAQEVVPELVMRLTSRVAARFIRYMYT